MQPDDLESPSDRVRARRLARRATLTRRGLLVGGLVAAGGAVTALVAATLPDGGSPDAAPRDVASLPVPVPTEGTVSPAAEPAGAQTLLSIWAHPDDDIIFSNPGLTAAIAEGATVRTVFVTGGDAGRGLDYMRSRELGIMKAYNRMRGSTADWTPRQITLLTGARVTRFVPDDDPRFSLTMLRLPDGNLDATGFAATGRTGLTQLLDGRAPTLSPLDGSPALDVTRLRAGLAELVGAARPTRVSTHIPRGSAFAAGDHPDHSCVGELARGAAPAAGVSATAVSYFLGYPSQSQPVNVSGGPLDDKVETYRTYAQDDPVIRCADAHACLAQRGFGEWLRRSYSKSDAELQLR
ncbi:MAG: hypothetical protein FJW64_14390 [Actinobacteria bacterium]|nr:hypothetical protein [Actinomycetota bacterium]